MINFLKKFNLSEFIPQCLRTIQVFKETFPFIKENRLWTGYFDYKWIAIVSILISIAFTYVSYKNLVHNYFPQTEQTDSVVTNMNADVQESIEDVKAEGKRGAFTSGTKYILIILLEIIIFYFSVKTLAILTDRPRRPTFKEFVKAEKRMIKIMLLSFFKGIGASIVVSMILGILGLSAISPFVMFAVYGYFMGYAFLDNYNEQFEHKIKQSQEIIRKHFGAAVTIGIVVSILIYIPLLGPLFGPIIGSVAGAIYGERYKIETELLPLVV
jgi:thiamine transporter ThiT